MPLKSDKASGFASFTYEDAKREIEKAAPQFSVQKQNSAKGEIELPFAMDDGEDTFRKTPEARGGAMEKDKEKESDLRDAFADLHFEKNVLEVNASETISASAERQNERQDFFAENKKLLEEMENKAKQNKIDVASCVYAGKLFNTYLLYERGEEVFIIDQHAAHERLIFNRLKEQMQSRRILQQPMLLPFMLDLNAFESAFIRENLENIRDIGFDIEEFGNNAFKISAVPLDLQEIDLKAFFNEILGDVSGYRCVKLEDLLKDKLATAACKAAVKGGMDLTREEVDRLFALMDGNMGLKCPHGRPVVVKMTKTDLEKMFKRIV